MRFHRRMSLIQCLEVLFIRGKKVLKCRTTLILKIKTIMALWHARKNKIKETKVLDNDGRLGGEFSCHGCKNRSLELLLGTNTNNG